VRVPLPAKVSLIVRATLFVIVPLIKQSLKVILFPLIVLEVPDSVVLLLEFVFVQVPLLLMFPATTKIACDVPLMLTLPLFVISPVNVLVPVLPVVDKLKDNIPLEAISVFPLTFKFLAPEPLPKEKVPLVTVKLVVTLVFPVWIIALPEDLLISSS
jgi:hypothetical protein